LYQADGISVFEWRKDAKGWFTVEINAVVRLNARCSEVGLIAQTRSGAPLVCTKLKRNLAFRSPK
jgi:hypothetical protein